jgi:hypothetical protein
MVGHFICSRAVGPVIRVALHNAIVSAAAAAFVVVSIFGQGLHLLPGFGHGDHLGSEGECQHHCGGCFHNTQPEVPLVRGDGVSIDNSSGHICLLCQFLVQGKLPAPAPFFLTNACPISQDTTQSVVFCDSCPLRPFDARGPPRAI